MLARRGRRTPAGGGSGCAFTAATVDPCDRAVQPHESMHGRRAHSCKRLRYSAPDQRNGHRGIQGAKPLCGAAHWSVSPSRTAGSAPKGGPVNVVAYAALAAVPAVFFLGFARALDWWARGGRQARSTPAVAGPPIERLFRDLRPLALEYSPNALAPPPRRTPPALCERRTP